MLKMITILLILGLVTVAEMKLYQAVAIISQGARYHVNDLYDGSETKQNWGDMTPVGLRQQQTLGKLFKKQYTENELLSSAYIKDQVQVITTTINSTIQSGLANLYGMYPLGNGQTLQPAKKQYRLPPYSYKDDVDQDTYALPKGQLIQPISYNSALVQDCPNQKKQVEKNIRQQYSVYQEMILTYTPFLKKMANTFKIDPSVMNFTKLCSLYDTIRVDRYLGRSLPSQFTNEDLQNIQHLYYWYNHFTHSYNLSKAFSTFTLNQVIGNFDAKIKSPNSARKWTTVSTFEGDLISIQNNLNISSASCIQELYRKGSSSALNCQGKTPFASSIIFELYLVNDNTWSVQVRNNGKYIYLCNQKQISCEYQSFKTYLKTIIVPDPQGICGRTQIIQPQVMTE